jgi:hypothetical protein
MGRRKGSTNKQAAKNKQFVIGLDRMGLDINQIEVRRGARTQGSRQAQLAPMQQSYLMAGLGGLASSLLSF